MTLKTRKKWIQSFIAKSQLITFPQALRAKLKKRIKLDLTSCITKQQFLIGHERHQLKPRLKSPVVSQIRTKWRRRRRRRRGRGVAGHDEYCMRGRLHNAALVSQKFKALNNNEAPQWGRLQILQSSQWTVQGNKGLIKESCTKYYGFFRYLFIIVYSIMCPLWEWSRPTILWCPWWNDEGHSTRPSGRRRKAVKESWDVFLLLLFVGG